MADQQQVAASRRDIKPAGLVLALVFLAVASVGFTGDPWWLFTTAAIWTAAAAVALIGVLLLVSALPGRRRRR